VVHVQDRWGLKQFNICLEIPTTTTVITTGLNATITKGTAASTNLFELIATQSAQAPRWETCAQRLKQ
jgi:hypothetical protein